MVVVIIDIVGGPGGGFGGPGGGFRGPGGGFSDSKSSGKPLLLLRLKKPLPGAPKPPPGPPKPKKTKQHKAKSQNPPCPRALPNLRFYSFLKGFKTF